MSVDELKIMRKSVAQWPFLHSSYAGQSPNTRQFAGKCLVLEVGFIFVRRRFWHSIPPALDTPSFLPPLALTAPCMRTLAPQIMRLSAPPALPSPLSHRWAASADEPIGLIQHHRVNGESQGLCGLHIDDELNFCVRLYRELRWLRPLENLVHQARRLPA